ncbi:hypothetical protein [Rhodovarius lipocyclicus]|uniref:hypothetical protein n=1 Tax=Rhodovarius lipocyclicus TaxID=268410 RepID=UPI00135933CD|nr:hypothetical protein [Rhodovarius lipocyclicus]
MSILDFPTSIIGPGQMQLTPLANTQSGGRSPFDGTEQTLELPGGRWKAVLTYRLAGTEARTLEAFLARLGGRAGRFRWGPPGHALQGNAQFSVATTAAIDGAAQTGSMIHLKGWTPYAQDIFLPGDYLAWLDPSGRPQLHMVTNPGGVPADSSGLCSTPIWPPIRRSPADGAAINFSTPHGIFRLSEDEVVVTHSPAGVADFTINIEEALV